MALSAVGERLCINLPYGHGKTMLGCWYFVAWVLLCWPRRRVILVAHGEEFAETYGGKVKEIVTRWGPEVGVEVKADTRAKAEWGIARWGGGLTCGGPESGIGRHGDLFVVDDLVRNWQQALSPRTLEGHWHFFKTTILSRMRRGTSCLVIGTRWGANDHFGRIRELERRTGKAWRWLILPALALKDDPLGRAEGEPLWPAMVGPEELAVARAAAGRWWSAGWQQDPSPEEGSFFKPSTWPAYVDTGDAWSVPDVVQRRRVVRRDEVLIVVAADWATSEKATSDATAVAVGGLLADGRLMILEVVNERLPLEAVVPRLAGVCRKWRPDVAAVEAGGFQDAMANECRRFPEIPEPRRLRPGNRSKLGRAVDAIVMGQGGRILLPDDSHAPPDRLTGESDDWCEPFCRQLAGFTGGGDAPDDMVDALSWLCQTARFLRPGRRGTGEPCRLDRGREGGFNAPWTLPPGMQAPYQEGGW